jgi:hypothetical protein
VFTNFLSQDEPQDWRLYRRVTNLDRKERLKLVDPGLVRKPATVKQVLRPDDSDVLRLDVTRWSPERTAQAILDEINRLDR